MHYFSVNNGRRRFEAVSKNPPPPMDALFSKWLTSTLTPRHQVKKSGKKSTNNHQPTSMETTLQILYTVVLPVKVQRESHSIPPRVWVRVCGLAYHVLDQLTSTTCVGAFVWPGLSRSGSINQFRTTLFISLVPLLNSIVSIDMHVTVSCTPWTTQTIRTGASSLTGPVAVEKLSRTMR